jgi:hypothetical protein
MEVDKKYPKVIREISKMAKKDSTTIALRTEDH